jgi:hypothetical protein
MLYLWLIIFLVGGDVSVNRETFLVTDFVNFKIKLTQSFKYAHRGKVCVRVFIGVSSYIYIYMNIYVYTVFLKKH